MWFWCWAPLSTLWWLFPLMIIVCMVMMFVTMRAFITGRFPCRPTRRMVSGHGHNACCGEDDGGRKAPTAKEGYSMKNTMESMMNK